MRENGDYVKKWKIISLVFIILTTVFFLLTFVFSSLYISELTARRQAEKRIEQLQERPSSSSTYSSYSDSYDDYDYDDTYYTYNFGDAVDFKEGLSIAVTSAEEDSSVKMNNVLEGEKKIVVSLTVANETKQDVTFYPEDFVVYSESSYAFFNSATYDNDIPDKIASGKTEEIKLYFTCYEGEPFAVNYGDVIWSGSQKKNSNSI
ncbi:DUF4352 domain-containing protein [Streptococcus chenjunshii]|uniref:DUF4352 domain-containing protein n=1 Tax=Streptococcus chenjunshii TaxID=2173853 RepID=A0A372KMS9_9STRE|nr:DUF4352 domain-containing protein [Streptococcus chenjunshii]AXQ78964.1 DUF4352 domain-containing protein [Streptococcus chenjunshii]RFU51391.1 DUF4352 domain-containing protein [Streptococcus chenjunshii]RFU53591.1 DUF4352 domain-containing protein [Streptococcus chenjunshii]